MDPQKHQIEKNDAIVSGIRDLLEQHRDKRIVVVGTTCTGKSTMLSQIPGARDQDTELFPKLSKQETKDVCQTPWTEEIGHTMIRLARERLRSEVGKPLFGTVVIDADLIIFLKITDALLSTRVAARGTNLQDAKNMQIQLEREVKASGLASIEYRVG